VVVCCRAGHILPYFLFVRFPRVNRWRVSSPRTQWLVSMTAHCTVDGKKQRKTLGLDG
jgi:hypothetical protein